MRIERTITIDRPTDAVFAVLADYSRDTVWRAGVTEMTASPPGPAQVGTRTHEVLRFLGSTYVTDAAVTAYEPGSELAFRGTGSAGEVAGIRAVEPARHDRRHQRGAQPAQRGHADVDPPAHAGPRAGRLDGADACDLAR